jgi:hypothetical protein
MYLPDGGTRTVWRRPPAVQPTRAFPRASTWSVGREKGANVTDGAGAERRRRADHRRKPLAYDTSVAIPTERRLDAHTLRADCPVFEQLIHGKPLSFLDSAE